MKLQLRLFFFLFATAIYGQDNATLISGALRADFGNNGALLGPNGSPFLSLNVDGEYVPLLFEAGLLMGGVDPGGNLKLHDLRGSGSTLGIIGNTDPVEKYWRVTAEEIAAHQADFADNGVIDEPIPAIFAWPGRGNASFEEYNGFNITSTFNYVAPFWDNDFDTIYEPQDGDYPILEIRGCLETPIVVSEMVFFPIMSAPNDATEPTIQIYLIAFRVGCEEVDNPINNAIFLRYKIINRNVERREDYHFGFFADGDIGCSTDDYLGTFPDRFASYFYNSDTTDDGCIGGQSNFGDNPPAFAIDLFRLGLNEEASPLPLGSTMPIYNAANGADFPAATLDYNTPLEAYHYLRGTWRDGSPLLNESIGYNNGEPVNFAFTDDPFLDDGWSEVAESNPSGDRRVMMSSGDFTHYPGAVNEFILGFTYNDDPNANNLEKISGLQDNVDLIQSLFDGCFEVNEFTSELLGCNPLTTDLDEINPASPRLSIYPNPASSILQIELENSAANGLLQIYQSNGQLMTVAVVNTNTHQLDVTDWPKGIYLLQWKSNDGITTEKLVIQ